MFCEFILIFITFLISIYTFFVPIRAYSSSNEQAIKSCGKFFYSDSERDTAKQLLNQATTFPRLDELSSSHRACATCGLRGALELLAFNGFSETKYVEQIINLMTPIVLYYYYASLDVAFFGENGSLEVLLKPIKPPFEIAYSSEHLEKIFNLAMILFESNQREKFIFFSEETMIKIQRGLTLRRKQVIEQLVKRQQRWVIKNKRHSNNIIDAESVFNFFNDILEELKFYVFLNHSLNFEKIIRNEMINKPFIYPENKIKFTPIAFPNWNEFFNLKEVSTALSLKNENEIVRLVEESVVSRNHIYLLHSFIPEKVFITNTNKRWTPQWAHWSDAIYWHASHLGKRNLESSQHMFVVVGFFKSPSENFNIDRANPENMSYLVVADLVNGKTSSLDGLRILPFPFIMEQGIDLIKVEWVPFSKDGLF